MYYFVFGINNSGTTVVSQYLARQADAYLPPFGHNEGQDAPAVKQIFRTQPWKRDKQIDWGFVRREWDALLTASGKNIFVEGSPPMMMWVEQIKAAFGADLRGMFLTASPYMQIASCLKNYSQPPLTSDCLDKYCRQWLFKSRIQAQNIVDNPKIPYLRYEDFCADPTWANAAFGLPVNKDAMQITGKGWHRRGKPPDKRILDFTVRTIAFLTPADLSELTNRLRPHQALIETLGYTLWSDDEIQSRLATAPGQRTTGQQSRTKWEDRA